MMKHWHHIIPKHMGGTDSSDNLILLSIEEHAEAHRKLWEEQGKWQDKIAWQTLSGQISIQDVREKMMKEHNPMHRMDVIEKMSGENHWSKRPGKTHNIFSNNPMHRMDVIEKMSGENHWSKRPGKTHNAKINHPRGSSKKIMIDGVVYSSIKSASDKLQINLRKVKKIGIFI
jgi:hypothetical protein